MHALLLCLAAALPAAPDPLAPPPSVAVPAAFQEEEVPDKRPEVKQWLTDLRERVKKEEDTEAIALIDTLLVEFEKSGPKDRAEIADGVAACLGVKRKDVEEGVPEERLQLAAATALGRMGPESVGQLVAHLEHKALEDKQRARRAVILALGYTKHEDGIKPLKKLLQDHQPWVQAACAEALGQYSTADQEIRKDLVEWLLKVVMPVKNAVEENADDPVARERYDTIATPFLTALQTLTGHDARDFYDWQRWWNNNKKKDWDQAS